MNDLKFALRLLLKNPGFSAIAILTLALGIGATTTMFSVVNGVLLKPLDFEDSDRIVYVYESDPEKGFQRRHTSPATFLDWRRESSVFETLSFTAEYAGQTTRSFLYLGKNGDPAERFHGRFVPNDYFATYGVAPFMGRSFNKEEEQAGSARTVVLSHTFWANVLGSDPDIIGNTITLENQGRHTYEVIGILPESPRVPGGDIFSSCAHMGRPMTRRGGPMLRVIGKLKPDVSVAQAQAELSAIQSRIHDEHGHLAERGSHLMIGQSIDVFPLKEATVGNVRKSLYIFSGAVLLVLLTACANVANLLLSRALTRQREVAIRSALGASRIKIVRQLMAESITLSLMGGIVGAMLSYWGLQLLIQFNADSVPRIAEVTIDPWVLGFTLFLSVVTGLIFGLVPALQTSKADLNHSLKEGSTHTTGSRFHHGMSHIFTVAQVALALILLIGAGLLLQSFNKLQSIDLGFKNSNNLLTVDVVMNGAAYKNESQRRIFIKGLLERMNGTSGVEDACLVSMIPDRGNGWPTRFPRMDQPQVEPNKRPTVNTRVVTPRFLSTYGIALQQGREFSDADSEKSQPVAMINQAFADKYFPDENPLGKLIECGGRREIIGIISNVKNAGIRNDTQAEVFFPYTQWENPSGFLTVRASNPMALAPVVTEYVRQLNPEQPLKFFKTMDDYIDRAYARPRFRSMLIGVFALIALILASIGIYSVMAYSISQRTSEMGIRMALGAQRRDVLLLVLKQGLKLTLLGICIGLAGSPALTRVLQSYLYNINAADPWTYLGIAGFLVLIGTIACIIPAARAMKISPNEALRYE